jgi:hypothetical protein
MKQKNLSLTLIFLSLILVAIPISASEATQNETVINFVKVPAGSNSRFETKDAPGWFTGSRKKSCGQKK